MTTEKPILLKGGQAVDDRGSLRFVNEFDPQALGVKRFYQVQNHRAGFIRAWHGHKNESKYVYVPQGAALVCATLIDPGDPFPDVPGRPDPVIHKFVLSESNPSILYIPRGYFNGFKTLTDDAILVFFSTSTLEESKGDDIREPHFRFGESVWTEDYR